MSTAIANHESQAHLFRLIIEQRYELLNGLQFLELLHVLLRNRAFPNSPSDGRQQLLIVLLLQQAHQRLEPTELPHQITDFLLLGALEDRRGAMHLQLFVGALQILHEVLDHSLGADRNAVALLNEILGSHTGRHTGR